MPRDTDLSPYFSMRISPRVRYFAELAGRITGVTLTKFTEDAILASFENVSLNSLAEDEPGTIQYPLSDKLDSLWSDHAIVRLELMYWFGYERLMSKEEKAILAYLFTRPDLSGDPANEHRSFNRRLINEQWEAIKAQALRKDGGE